MVIYVYEENETQEIFSRGKQIQKDEWKVLFGKTIKNIQKFDKKIMITLK